MESVKIQRPFQLNSSPEGVLRISSDRDDRMGAKIKTQKNLLGFKQNPKKSLDQNLSPKECHAEFPSHNKNFCIKWFNTKNRNISFRLQNSRFFLKITKEIGSDLLFVCSRVVKLVAKIRTVLQSTLVLNTPKNPYLNQANKKLLAKIFLTKKIPKSKISNPQKPCDHPCHSKSGVPSHPPPPHLPRNSSYKKF